jgi:hypothetical protein
MSRRDFTEKHFDPLVGQQRQRDGVRIATTASHVSQYHLQRQRDGIGVAT